MSYCQKHRNHHCVHSHNCKDPQHKKKSQRLSSSSSMAKCCDKDTNKKYTAPMGTILDSNQQCEFTFQLNPHQSSLANEGYIKKIESLTTQLQQTKRKLLAYQIKNRQLDQKNNHTQCQIEYLRTQLDLLVNNHNADISTEIKRNLIEHTRLSIKINQLTSALFDKQKLSQQLSSENYSLLRKNKQLQATIKSYQDKLKLIINKNQQLSFSSTQAKGKINQLETELRTLKDRYNILASAADKSTKSASNSTNQLTNTKEKLQKSLKAKQAENKRLKELHQVEKKTWQKIIQDLKQQATKRSQDNKKIKQKAKNLENELSQLKEDFEHAKKMVLKYEKMNLQFGKAEQMLKKRREEDEQNISRQQKKTVLKINSNQCSKNLETKLEQIERQKQELQERVKQLQNQLQQKGAQGQYQSRVFKDISSKSVNQTVVINQELILSIGASQQFKRLLEQKNATIKKLMREKAELYNKIYQQQVHG